MLEGHELTHPIAYGYLFLAAAILLLACITVVIYIIKGIKDTATSAPDYHRYWKNDKARAKMKAFENSYAKSRGLCFFDWEDSLTRIKEGRCSDMEIEELIIRATGFDYMPSAYLDKDIPRDDDHCPKDKTLLRLESDFWVRCVLREWLQAWKFYEQIQHRGYQLMIYEVKQKSLKQSIIKAIKP